FEVRKTIRVEQEETSTEAISHEVDHVHTLSTQRKLYRSWVWNSMRKYVRSLSGLYDFIATVVVCAPDGFRTREFREADDQLTLDRAFEELRVGLAFVKQRPSDPEFLARLDRLLDASLAAYRSGEQIAGAHLLQD